VTIVKDIFLSPLRYPGGKAVLSTFLKDVLIQNNIKGTYCEAYAGGAGAALELLFSKKVSKIILNDADYHIYAFWRSILHDTERFIAAIKSCRISIGMWERQREIYDNSKKYNRFEVGFSTFFLNRCNRGGILPGAGPIGGIKQEGKYLINARFNKGNLISRIQKIAASKSSIQVKNLDALEFLQNIRDNEDPHSTFIYLDPPYFQQGKNLYLNFYDKADHQSIEEFLRNLHNFKWLVSYDNVPEIKNIYEEYRLFPFDLNYSVQITKKGKELIIFSGNLVLPEYFTLGKFKEPLICI
jgi:DNA adenine methylase